LNVDGTSNEGESVILSEEGFISNCDHTSPHIKMTIIEKSTLDN